MVNPDCLVQDTAVFKFTDLEGLKERDIVNKFAFGLGTAPDSLLTPEPATICLLGLGTLIFFRKQKA
ncbi:MAG: PEP-CTERM sorting domain-containing protein [Sedimentisphaerales bacterium]|nr:PEP-CTERM sorting domain-containing protein [Sedimentisphaerales bacterium]